MSLNGIIIPRCAFAINTDTTMGVEAIVLQMQKAGHDCPDSITVLRKHSMFGVSASLCPPYMNAYRSRRLKNPNTHGNGPIHHKTRVGGSFFIYENWSPEIPFAS